MYGTRNNQRRMRSDNVANSIPPDSYWNIFFPADIDQPKTHHQSPHPTLELKFGNFTTDEDELILKTIRTQPVPDTALLAASLCRERNGVVQRIRQLQRNPLNYEYVSSSPNDSMAMLERFLAVEEESSVDLDAAVNIVTATNTVSTELNYEVSSCCQAGEHNDFDDICFSDLSSNAIEYLMEGVEQEVGACGGAGTVCATSRDDATIVTQEDSGVTTFAQYADQINL